MKKNLNYCPSSSGMSKIENRRNNMNLIGRLVSALCLAFVSVFMFTSAAIAQSAESPDMTNQFKEDKADLQHDKTMVREVRREKQELKALNNIPGSIMDKFAFNYPKAQNVAWSVPGNYVQVDFTLNGKSKTAYYDYDNHLIGDSHYLNYSALPAKARDRIAKDYKDYTPVKTMFYDDNEDNDLDMVLYEMPLAKDSYFVELKNANKQIVVQVDTDGEVSYFSDLK